jgi:hypothetical protein
VNTSVWLWVIRERVGQSISWLEVNSFLLKGPFGVVHCSEVYRFYDIVKLYIFFVSNCHT